MFYDEPSQHFPDLIRIALHVSEDNIARLDLGARDASIDEGLGLNCAWFADALVALAEIE